ncbi:MAG TPA: hypothetical protein PLM24_02985 [Methanothrix sp.]|nr:hypothetical protein [Methanothrix sp.]HPJ83800.1 hypothetical protein [Methanothrix sp.]HPR66080.1 hypothetical protein [Methanothrix sp.]
MRGVGTITGILAALLVTLMVVGPSLAADNPNGYYLKNEQKLEQDVEGEGYVMVYQNVNTQTLQFQNYMHGSGSMDSATLLSSNQSCKSYYPQDKNTHVYLPYKKAYFGNISFVEQNEMTYSPVAMAYGTGYYAENPIVYNSKLKEKTQSKSYQEGVSMHHQIEYASAFVKDIGVDLMCKDPIPAKSTEYSSSPKKGIGLTRMNIEEEVTEGSVHVGQLVTKADPDYGWKDPLIEIDENYIGSFKITKNMEVCVSKSGMPVRKDWLSCCIGGYGEMGDDDKAWGEEEIFDCTCREKAWGDSWNDTSTAQFPRE